MEDTVCQEDYQRALVLLDGGDKRHVHFIVAVLHLASYKEEAEPNESAKGLNHVKTTLGSSQNMQISLTNIRVC